MAGPDVASCWPGREAQVASLKNWLSGRAASHIIVHGPSGTGKTSIVRHCLEAWGHRYAYTALPQEYKLRQLFNALLSQLWGLKRKRDAGFGATAGADSWNEFAEAVAAVCPPGAPRCSVLVLDNMEWGAHKNMLPQLLAAIKWQRASLVVVAITSTAPQDLRYGPAVGLGSLPLMHCLHFPAYSREQLAAVLAANPPKGFGTDGMTDCPPGASMSYHQHQHHQHQHPGSAALLRELWGAFCSTYVANNFAAVSRSAADLAAVAGWLWPLYSRPLQEGKVRTTGASVETVVRQLDGLMQQQQLVKKLLEVYRPGMRNPPPVLQALAVGSGSAAAAAALGSGGDADGGGGALVANLGKAAKLLLLAAFVASRNKPTLDKDLFDYRTKPGGRRRGGRNGAGPGRAGEAQQEADRQAEAAKEARLKGPHAFPLTRLISIFHRLWASVPSLGDDAASSSLYGGSVFTAAAAAAAAAGEGPGAAGYGGGGGGGVLDVDLATGFAGGRNGLEAVWSQSAAVLSAVTGLQGMGLLAKHGSGDDPLEQPRFTCAIDDPLAQRLAADVNLQLNNYLMYDK
ncbi:hypothetical protein HYH02_012386 [Chlamydomonas schloesseri]|uniref:Orc1-like AAA ATPase domain-containing protein n=1 Tax=Chlamydomonas schloesseri TaxID=2026947 RepID=A0A835SZ38_9CHLO|nr:hypothetical protein HYH02_012386 [Chlamydomonas schloesseri]|eukprot:KAG2434371.1 hypothetical protein HYH02_012386 [Chlamydomonas schloesseri]